MVVGLKLVKVGAVQTFMVTVPVVVVALIAGLVVKLLLLAPTRGRITAGVLTEARRRHVVVVVAVLVETGHRGSLT